MTLRGILRPVFTLLFVLFACAVLPALVMLPVDMIGGRNEPQTAEEAVRRAVCSPGKAPAEFNERQRRRFEGGMLVTYDAWCPSPSGGVSAPFPGHVAVERLPRFTFGPPDKPIWGRYFWQADAFPPMGTYYPPGPDTGPPSRAGLVAYGTASGEGGAYGRYAVVGGRVLAPGRVASVEAVFDNGRTVRQRADRGVFAIGSLGAKEAKELRALDADGRVLQSIRVPRGQ
jgi:hypothetical protein